MRCQYCEDFDYDKLITDPGYKHHRSWQALCSSAVRGCAVCALVTQEARGRWQWEREQEWKEMEETEQIYCSFSHGNIHWNYGSIQRSRISVCVSGKSIQLHGGHMLTLYARWRRSGEPHPNATHVRVRASQRLYRNDARLAHEM